MLEQVILAAVTVAAFAWPVRHRAPLFTCRKVGGIRFWTVGTRLGGSFYLRSHNPLNRNR